MEALPTKANNKQKLQLGQNWERQRIQVKEGILRYDPAKTLKAA